MFEKDWNVWEKKSLGTHRGVIDWPTAPPVPIDVLASRVREGVKREFKPGWFRGFGFGTILHFNTAPADFTKICGHIDRRNRIHGVWQWAIVQFDKDKVALGIHTWQHGYLRPVYESILEQLAARGYQCHSVDAEVDPLIETLRKIGSVCHTVGGIGPFAG